MPDSDQLTRKIPICKGYARARVVIAHAIVDECVYDTLAQYSWHLSTGYPFRTVRGGIRNMTYDVMEFYFPDKFPLPPLEYIDHRNRNRLDARRENLRFVTPQINVANSSLRVDNTSGFKGVTWDKANNKWIAQVQFQGRHKKLGRFRDKQAAAMAVNEAYAQLFPDVDAPNQV